MKQWRVTYEVGGDPQRPIIVRSKTESGARRCVKDLHARAVISSVTEWA